jgi:potassium voltage-gated channel Shal-related subfamily D member 2
MRSILNKYPKTLLGSNELDYYYDDKTKEYFFDRDPKMFRHILNFYRTGKLHYPKSECLALYEQELALFGIQTDKISDCCIELHEENKSQNDERIQIELKINNKPKKKLSLTSREALWTAFEDPKSSLLSMVLYYVIGFFIILSVLANIIETVHLDNKVIIGEKYKDIFFVLDTTCVLIFTIEYILRLYSAPKRILFLKSLMSLIDLFSILPYYIMLVMPKNDDWSSDIFAAFKVLRIIRILKISRHNQGIKLIGLALKASFHIFSYMFVGLSALVVLFATLMYYLEKDIKNSIFTSIPASFWYALVTLNTIG